MRPAIPLNLNPSVRLRVFESLWLTTLPLATVALQFSAVGPMPLILLLLPFVIVLLAIVLMPLSLVQRYRVGTATRQARAWVATLNAAAMGFSVAFFMATSAMMSFFVPGLFADAALGLAIGCALGIVGVWLTRWDASAGVLRYTPNRWLVLAITLLVTARVAYGVWRAWTSWRVSPQGGEWLEAAGLGGSLAAGAVVLGYYLLYWVGVRRRLRRPRAG